jgi:hypothetical protein
MPAGMGDVVLPRSEVDDLLVRLNDSLFIASSFPPRADVWTAAHRAAYRRVLAEAAVVHARLRTYAMRTDAAVPADAVKPVS